MSTTQPAALTVDELERLLKAVEPGAILTPAPLMRRVIKQDRQLVGLALLVPHRKGYVIERDALLKCVQPAELGLAPDAALPDVVYLLIRPDATRLARSSIEHALIKHGRILFHLHIDRRMQQKIADGTLTPALVRARIRRLGLTEFAEITEVLRLEEYLLPPDTPSSIYAEFVAVYLTLRRFAPGRLTHFFPALRDLAAVDALVAEDIDADAIYEATRLGARDEGRGASEEEAEATAQPSETVGLESPLVPRLQAALELSDVDAQRWSEALRPAVVLATRGAWGSWSQEARLLADLENVCIDSERGIYAVDVVGWVVSAGKLPVQRQLPAHQEVAIVRRLRGAAERLRHVRLKDSERQRLTELLHDAVENRECRMRERFRPLITAALDSVGMTPKNVPETIGRDKLVEELLDRVVEYGHFNIGNLRDAISRNQMKLPDLTGPTEMLRGDPLIRLNRELSVVLDGVYRRGEIYMRWLHRFSSAAFGTWLGRLLVLFLILPFGLAFFVMITPEIAMEEGEKLVNWIGRMIGTIEPADPHAKTHHDFPLPNSWGVLGLGVFFLLLFHVAWFRRAVFATLGFIGRMIRAVIRGVARSPVLRAIVHNRFWSPFRRVAFWPPLLGLAGWVLAAELWRDLDGPLHLAGISGSAVVAAGFFLLTIILLNTRLGGAIEETAIDRLLRLWVWLNAAFLPGLFRWIMDLSRLGLETVEQVLYTVNEWLRFRSGENRLILVIKAIAGLGWFCVTYVIRFAINLLIEPQINPIKHFPVVTVSHKVCLPMIPTLANVLRTAGVHRATTTATGIIFGIPGIFGFMVWELKENWKLYASNRSTHLHPVLIGSHGETMLRLLRPGFHSGTVPTLFARLRRAELHGQERSLRKLTAALHHVEESIAHFVERELVALLRQTTAWADLPIDLTHVHLATNRVLIELGCKAVGGEPLVLSIDHQDGWLLAGVLDPGWLPQANEEQRRTLDAALAGLYQLAGVDVTREQIAEAIPTALSYEICADRLVVWAEADREGDVAHDLNRLQLANTSVTWEDWVRRWNAK